MTLDMHTPARASVSIRAAAPTTTASLRLVLAERVIYLPDGSALALARNPVLWALLRKLADERLAAPGRCVAVTELVAAAWPGERVSPHSGARRVYTAVCTLRKMGLRTLIRRTQRGYFLDVDVGAELRA